MSRHGRIKIARAQPSLRVLGIPISVRHARTQAFVQDALSLAAGWSSTRGRRAACRRAPVVALAFGRARNSSAISTRRPSPASRSRTTTRNGWRRYPSQPIATSQGELAQRGRRAPRRQRNLARSIAWRFHPPAPPTGPWKSGASGHPGTGRGAVDANHCFRASP